MKDKRISKDYYPEDYIDRLRKTYNKVLRELNEVLKGLLTTVSVTAFIIVAIVTTAGIFSGPIAVSLVGSNFAGLSGAALTSASLAYLCSGAVAGAGLGIAGVGGKVVESVYCASKFGVKGFTESILKEVTDKNIHGIYMGGMNTNFWGDELADESETGLMNPDDVADIIIANTQERSNMNIPEVIIRNH